jgi:hypothetical protein
MKNLITWILKTFEDDNGNPDHVRLTGFYFCILIGYILGSNDKCQVKCLFFKDNDLVNDSTIVEVPKELVQNWQDDDAPLIDYVINKLGLIVMSNNQEVL